MSRTTWLLIGLSVIGAALGFWLMGVLVKSGAPRPKLVQRLESLPPLATLPPLAARNLSLLDVLETPGGPVWALLADRAKPASGATLCEFERKSAGGVRAPDCQRLEHRLARPGAQLAVGGADPLLIAPEPSAKLGAIAAHAETGREQALDTSTPESLTVSPQRGARLTRHFRLSETGRALTRISPDEGYYVGPVTGYANTRPPKVPPAAEGRLATCVTPAGYVHARFQSPQQAAQARSESVEISFVSKGEVVSQVSGSLPQNRALDGALTCGPSSAIFSYLTKDSTLGELTCSPAGCERSVSRFGDVNLERVVTLARVGPSTLVLWRGPDQQPLWRLGSVASFERAPTAPLWKRASTNTRDEPPPWTLTASVGTGQSLLLFFDQGATTHTLQLYADGSAEVLAAKKSSDSKR